MVDTCRVSGSQDTPCLQRKARPKINHGTRVWAWNMSLLCPHHQPSRVLIQSANGHDIGRIIAMCFGLGLLVNAWLNTLQLESAAEKQAKLLARHKTLDIFAKRA